MTWSARLTDADGNTGEDHYSVCPGCQHVSTCQLPKMYQNVASMLTSVDTGCDGHMASGEAVLKCNGYEAQATEKPEGASD